MACSKIFSDLPELTNKIIQYFRNDLSTLYSCILVNRLWCRITIPLLWENPFLYYPIENYHFIEIYLSSLSEDDKMKLKEYEFDINLFSANTLFNYPSFIKCLNTREISGCIENWITNVKTLTTEEVKSLRRSHENKQPNFLNSARLICRLLFKVFIENEGNLHTFKAELSLDRDCDYFNNAIELILQNPNFIYTVENLRFNIFNEEKLTNFESFLSLLSSKCNSISTLDLEFNRFDLLMKNVSLINSKFLKKLSIRCGSIPLTNLLLSLKNSNCSNTLSTIVFYQINFFNINNIFILNEVFEQLNVLESVHIIYCQLSCDFIRQIINIKNPFKLRSLFLNQIFDIKIFQPLLQKFGEYLENFGFAFRCVELDLLLEFIKYCTRIKFLYLPGFDQILYPIFSLIQNNGQHLNYISISFHGYYMDYYVNELTKTTSIVLQNLGQILPSKLKCLYLYLYRIETRDFEIFLKNSQNTFFEKLLIDNEISDNQDLLPYLEEYIVKKKRVKYLAFADRYIDLFDFIDEYKLYNVEVQDCREIDVYDYINENY
ncbi:hypothetical protein C1645_878639 [Glomus cerebriforme]|uniref:F-box domain-containing protein n=1 Tax=Glomus cerebriforme TaxID=658196 RepID=A0A397SUD3_9GLOM|nr:hypothetical protein C1645_878639 [Glomus cerebriforme]